MSAWAAMAQAVSCGESDSEGYGTSCRVCGDDTRRGLCAFCSSWAQRYASRLRDEPYWALVRCLMSWDHVPDVGLWGCGEHGRSADRARIMAQRESFK